jgi:hypothetical protein
MKARNMIIVAVIIAVFVVSYALVLSGYRKESEKSTAAVSDTGDKDPNHIDVDVKLVSVDPTKGDMVVRLEFEPRGNLTSDGGVTIDRDLKFYVNSAVGKQEHDFPKGKRMNPFDLTLELFDGDANDYPFDEHRAELTLSFFAPASAKSAAKSEGAAPKKDEEGAAPETAKPEEGGASTAESNKQNEAAAEAVSDEANIPIGVDLYGSIHGLKIDAAKTADSTADYVHVQMKITRAITAKFFSLFIMVAMWALTIGVLLLTLNVILGKRKIEIGMFSFMGALLFAFPALRNSQPGTPPIGSFTDFAAFFWAEVTIALCLLAVVSMWLLRPQPE